jgi:hypothetical protein
MTALADRHSRCYRCRRLAKARCDAPRPRGQGGPCGKKFCPSHGRYVGHNRDWCNDCLTNAGGAGKEEE